MLTLTLVIPVYNEEHQIERCLNSVASQTVMPAEVIVVDNNSTDRTVEIARRYSFVRIVQEKNQGRGHARSAGFSAARHEIIGRIDADAQLDLCWVENTIKHFQRDDELMGLTGMGEVSFIPGFDSVKTSIFTRTYYWFAHAGFSTITMWGATMSLRKSAWNSVKKDVCLDDSVVHEDQDVSLWMAASGMKIEQTNDVLINTSGQTYRYLPKLVHYARLYKSTKNYHMKNGNLSSPQLRRINRLKHLPGWLFSIVLGIPLFVVSIALFPLDFIMAQTPAKTFWFGR